MNSVVEYTVTTTARTRRPDRVALSVRYVGWLKHAYSFDETTNRNPLRTEYSSSESNLPFQQLKHKHRCLSGPSLSKLKIHFSCHFLSSP